ncbi:RNA polymerase sigma factor [Paenibacillus cymbidii]|uniref:RNA polymerase sigma factor n=1 Tax=Paenibacillus cymbidii TaxID=1639034 RepID=UPI001080F4B0|nr:sigma-70 family RNA polymerase sigma factor [Paenibacillus cymbidii]
MERMLRHLRETEDKDAILREMMEKYGKEIWHYAYLMTRSSDAADDIAQDVFLKAYRGLYSFRGDSSLRTWLLTIARNTALSAIKTETLRRLVTLRLIRRQPHRNGPSAEAEFMARHATSRLWRIVLGLPRKLREVLVLEAHYQMNQTEIARLLGISPGTVKSRLHRARAQVGSRMKEETD